MSPAARSACALLLVCATALPAKALEAQGRLALAPTYDTNATRAAREADVRADEALVLYLGADALARPGGRHQLTLGLDGGGKLFRTERGQDQLAGRLTVADVMRLTEWLAPGLTATADLRLLRDGSRDASSLSGAATADLGPFGPLELRPRVAAGYRTFTYVPDERFSSAGPAFTLSLRLAPWRRHAATLFGELARRDFPDGEAFDEAGALRGPRQDDVLAAGGEWAYRGRLALGGGYGLTLTRSNGFGLSSERHRLHALAAGRLPWGLLVTTQLSLQLLRFPDGLFVAPDLLLVDDEENLSSLAAKLSRAIGAGFAVEARYQLYRSYFSRSPIEFERHVVGLGLAYRFDTGPAD